MAIDLVLKLREVRRMRGLSQSDVARLSGVGVKTISSFETGDRIGSLKLAQLERLLGAYGLTAAEFFGRSIETEIAPWDLDENQIITARLLDDLRTMPASIQKSLLDKFQLMIERSRRCMPPSERKSRPRPRYGRCRRHQCGSDR
jgi:transcriptional regulator with XRE-family HTH domain